MSAPTMTPQPTVYVLAGEDREHESLVFAIESIGVRVAQFALATDFLRGYDPAMPSCLIVIRGAPGMLWPDLLERLTNLGIRIPILLVSPHAGASIAATDVNADSVEIIEYPFDQRELLERIQKALDRDTAARKFSRRTGEAQSRLNRLTPRESEVLELILEGNTIKQLALHLEISAQTAAKHRSRILDKLRAANDAELVRIVGEARRVNDAREANGA
jgi:FixJ family two-component response regulator